MSGQVRAVRDGDGADDGEPEPVPVVAPMPHPLVPEPLEGLEQAVKLARWYHRPGVGDPHHGPAGRRPGLDLGPAAGHVVPDGVPDQVRHQAFRQPGITVGRRGAEPGVDGDVLGHGRGDGRQVEGLRAGDPALAARQREQRVDQLLLLPAEPQDFVAGGAQGADAGLRVAQGHLQHGPLGGQRGAQLVGRVGDEMPLRLERRLQPREQVVKGLAEPAELIIAAPGPQPPARLVAEMSRAVATIACNGRSRRPASSQPNPSEAATANAKLTRTTAAWGYRFRPGWLITGGALDPTWVVSLTARNGIASTTSARTRNTPPYSRASRVRSEPENITPPRSGSRPRGRSRRPAGHRAWPAAAGWWTSPRW